MDLLLWMRASHCTESENEDLTTEALDMVDLVPRLPHQLTAADPLQTARTPGPVQS